MVANLVDAIQQLDRLKQLVAYVASEFAGINLFDERVGNSDTTLWEDIKNVREKRNEILHKGLQATCEEAGHSIAVARTLLEEVFPPVIAKLDLHLHENMVICDKSDCIPSGNQSETTSQHS